MLKVFHGVGGPIVFTILLLLLPFMHGTFFESTLSLLFGRVHPVFVHFPIVLVLVTILLEWWSNNDPNKKGLLVLILLQLAFFSALLAVLAGICLFRSGDYVGALLQNHLWGSIALTVLLCWSLFFKYKSQTSHQVVWSRIYRSVLVLSGLIVFITGHWGGSLTHGRDFLTEPFLAHRYQKALKKTQALKTPESLSIYQDIIHPALKDHCGSCHNDVRSKGGLNLSSLEKMWEGGKSGKSMITAGRSEQSELFNRIILPADHEDLMPPEGKKPLDFVIVDLIKWWIEAGANPEDTLGAIPGDADLSRSIQELLPRLAENQHLAHVKREERKALAPKLSQLASRHGLHIELDRDTDSTYYVLSMTIPAQIVTDESLRPFLRYKNLFSKASLIASDISDEGMYYLGQMPNLKEIILAKSCINGSGLHYLKSLPHLEMVNLSHSDIDNKNAMILTEFPKLKEVYLFNTFVEPEIVTALDAYLRDTKVCLEEGPFY